MPPEVELYLDSALNELATSFGEEEEKKELEKKDIRKILSDQAPEQDPSQNGDIVQRGPPNFNSEPKLSNVSLNFFGLLNEPVPETGNLNSFFNNELRANGAIDGKNYLDASFLYSETSSFSQNQQKVFLKVQNTILNSAPTATDDGVATNQDASTANLHAALLANDTDPDTGDTLDITAVDTTVTLGSVAFNDLANSLVYSTGNAFDYLAAGATATDTFTYTLSDGNGGTDTATVSVTVTGVNDGPTATDDGVYGETVEGGSTVLITTADLLLNDSDPDTGDTITITSMSVGVGQGTLVNNMNGTWTYTPPADSLPFSGMANLTYTLQDSLGATDTSAFQIRVFNLITGTNSAETLSAADPNTPHKLVGLNGNDTLTGSNTRDIIDGGSGNDTLNGGDGDDDFLFSGSSGYDSLSGGNGYDRMLGSGGNDTVILNAFSGIEYVDLGAGTNIIQAGINKTLDFSGLTAGTSLLNVSYFTDNTNSETIIGTSGDDVFLRQSGWFKDTFLGGDGNDTFLVNGFAPEYDVFDGGNGYDQVLGTAGNDSLLVHLLNIEYIDLGTGTNYIGAVLGTTLDMSGFTHGVNLLGVSYFTDDVNAETIIGTAGADTININNDWFSDTFSGGDGDDTFNFSGNLLGNDTFNGGNGYDRIIGSAGNDTMTPKTMTGIEYIDLGAGTNIIGANYASTLDLSAFTRGVDLLGITYITDNTAGETLRGTNQDDTFLLNSDSWVENFYGNDGADTFMITATRNIKDILADFDIIEGDVIDISQVLSYSSGLGDLVSDFVQFFDSDGDPANGSGTVTMRVDNNGTTGGANFVDYFVFADQNMTMLDMINNGNLIVE